MFSLLSRQYFAFLIALQVNYIETSIYGSVTCPVNCCSPGKNLEIASISHKSNTENFSDVCTAFSIFVFMSLCSISYRRGKNHFHGIWLWCSLIWFRLYYQKLLCFSFKHFYMKIAFWFYENCWCKCCAITANRIWTPNLIHFYDFMSNKIPILIRGVCMLFIPLCSIFKRNVMANRWTARGLLHKKIIFIDAFAIAKYFEFLSTDQVLKS